MDSTAYRKQPSMNIPNTFEVADATGRWAGTFAGSALEDAEALVARLQELEPDAGWDWTWIR
ncbi:hypothetical protein [Streptomyces sp. NPDC086519]|uniref:hypothetical protein n=1 Tax=Streptomyces sp. NPDC086519 TaxID=3154863 RepID=UPI00343E3EB2